MSFIQRFWNAIKLPPAVPRPEWVQEPPPAWRRLLHSLKPPPAVNASGELLPAEIVRRRRLIGIYAVSGLALLAACWQGVRYDRGAPQRAQAALEAGRKLAASGQDKAAIDSISRAIAMNPKSAQAYLERGLLHQNRNEIGAAMQDIRQAIQLNPRLAEAHVALGGLYRDRNDLPHALEEFTAALTIEPNVDAYYQRGRIYQFLGDHRKAIEDFTAGVEALPEAPYLYRARATSELAMGDKQDAARDRRRAYGIENRFVSNPPPDDEP